MGLYIWKCLPDHIKTEDLVKQKVKHSSQTLKFFIIDILKKLPPEVEEQLVIDLTNESKIRSYVNRPLSERGHRAKGVARQSGLSPWSLDDVSSI
jgi:hypothetical protein